MIIKRWKNKIETLQNEDGDWIARGVKEACNWFLYELFFFVDASDVPFYVSGMFPMIDSDRLLALGASVSL